MKTIPYDILLIVVGMMLIVLRNFYATLGLPKAKTPEEGPNKLEPGCTSLGCGMLSSWGQPSSCTEPICCT